MKSTADILRNVILSCHSIQDSGLSDEEEVKHNIPVRHCLLTQAGVRMTYGDNYM